MNPDNFSPNHDKIWYHGTTAQKDFDHFKYANGDIGFHFGTLKQATERLKDKNADSAKIMKVKLNLNNPLRLRDISHFSHDAVKYELENHPDFRDNRERLKSLDNIHSDHHLRSYLKGLGYDGIVYKNEKEVPEAAEHIKKAQMHLDNFVKQTGSHPYRIAPEHKSHPEYLKHRLESSHADHMIKKHAEDSVIVFEPQQIQKTPNVIHYQPSMHESFIQTESFKSHLARALIARLSYNYNSSDNEEGGGED